MNLRKLRAIVGAALLIGSLTVIALPTHVLANQTNCEDIPQTNYHTGITILSGNTDRDGVAATIDPYINPTTHAGFRPCNDLTGNDLVAGSSAWVAYTSNTGACAGFAQGACILQVGVINCDDIFIPACEDDTDNGGMNGGGGSGTEFVGFYALGGCNPLSQPVPLEIHSFGTYSAGAHEYKIAASANNRWSLSIDYGTPNVHIVYVDRNDPAINCWDNPATMNYAFDGERRDGGDSLGDTSSNSTAFTGMESHIVGGNWGFFSFADSVCSYAEGPGTNMSGCVKGLHSDWMHIWSHVG